MHPADGFGIFQKDTGRPESIVEMVASRFEGGGQTAVEYDEALSVDESVEWIIGAAHHNGSH
jgi:hypothetical protein